jgi:hypothetical protein
VAEWEIEEPTTLELDEVVRSLEVRLVSGHVDVVTRPGDGATVEVSAVDHEPVTVTLVDGVLTLRHGRVDHDGLLARLGIGHLGIGRLGIGRLGIGRLGIGLGLSTARDRTAVVSVAVPAECAADIAVVAADAVVSGVGGPVSVKSVSGDIVLDATGGPVTVRSVSGDLEARGLAGVLTMETVSGALTVVDGYPTSVRAKNVSGDITMDLRSGDPATAGSISIDVVTVSGDLTMRVPEDSDMRVDVLSATGDVSSTFDHLVRESHMGVHRLCGRLGAGAGALRGRTVSGSVALLARGPA